jgi:hypothetical protein
MAHIGRRNTIGIALEEVKGVAQDPQFYIPYLECDLQEQHEPIADSQARGIRDLQGPLSVEGKKHGEGNISVVLDPVAAPFWFGLALGDISSAPDGGDYKHTIGVATNDPLTATIWRGRVIDELDFVNSVCNTLAMTFSDDVASLSASILSKYPVASERSATVETDLKYYTFRDANVKIGTNTNAKVKEFTLDINNNAEALYAPGSNDVNDIVWKGLEVTGSFVLNFDDVTLRDAAKDLTKTDIVVTFTGPDDNEIEITIPRSRIKWELSTPNDDLATETMEFTAEYDTDTSKTIQVEVVNDVESYIDIES